MTAPRTLRPHAAAYAAAVKKRAASKGPAPKRARMANEAEAEAEAGADEDDKEDKAAPTGTRALRTAT